MYSINNFKNTLEELKQNKKIHLDDFILQNCCYLCITGSHAYGVNEKNSSDFDIYGITIPPLEIIFPHINGYILGFGTPPKKFEHWQQHHVNHNDREYDFSIYNIVKFFDLLLNNNPNIVDSIFVPDRCVLYKNNISDLIIKNRRLFLSKLSYHRFSGYAMSMKHKMLIKNPIGKRKELVDKFGYDTKFACHTVRLLNQLEQILTTEDLILDYNNQEIKAIRKGEYSLEHVLSMIEIKLQNLEKIKEKSKLQNSSDQSKIKKLLLNCLEMQYGSLDNIIKIEKDVFKTNILKDLESLIEKYK